MTKRISILGSTGSIGINTLNVARHLGEEKIQIVSLAARSNTELLEKQIEEFRPSFVGIYEKEKVKELKKKFPNLSIEGGIEGIIEAARYPSSQLVVCAISGSIGLLPTVAAINAGKEIALANKEVLVCAGELIMNLAAEKKVTIIPIDSEHSAIFQCLHGEDIQNVKRLILTASGGPFLNYSMEQLATIKVEEALKHPNWSMGLKNTIDSSTLMNKGLELIEARWLFNVPTKNLEVIIHPQSIIHSLVEYLDGSMLAQMSIPTMLVPIQYALTYPKRELGMLSPFDFIKNNTLQFLKPDLDRFKCLKLAFDSLNEGGSMSCYMNGANEVLVNRFISKEISWLEISKKLNLLLEQHQKQAMSSIEEAMHIDLLAREEASQF